jgi:hypothetical protein
MNRKKITTSKQTQIMAVAIIATSVIAAAMIVGINNGQNLQKVIAQEVYPLEQAKQQQQKHQMSTRLH